MCFEKHGQLLSLEVPSRLQACRDKKGNSSLKERPTVRKARNATLNGQGSLLLHCSSSPLQSQSSPRLLHCCSRSAVAHPFCAPNAPEHLQHCAAPRASLEAHFHGVKGITRGDIHCSCQHTTHELPCCRRPLDALRWCRCCTAGANQACKRGVGKGERTGDQATCELTGGCHVSQHMLGDHSLLLPSEVGVVVVALPHPASAPLLQVLWISSEA